MSVFERDNKYMHIDDDSNKLHVFRIGRYVKVKLHFHFVIITWEVFDGCFSKKKVHTSI